MKRSLWVQYKPKYKLLEIVHSGPADDLRNFGSCQYAGPGPGPGSGSGSGSGSGCLFFPKFCFILSSFSNDCHLRWQLVKKIEEIAKIGLYGIHANCQTESHRNIHFVKKKKKNSSTVPR